MELNKQNFKQEIEDYQGIALVDFYAPWCGPCQLMLPIIDELLEEYKDKPIKIGKLNIDANQEIAEKYNVMSVPTFLVFKAGKIIDQKIGYGSKEDIKNLIDKNI